MSDESSTRRKPPWSKCLVRKWFNIKSKGQLFQDVDDSISKGGDGEWRSSSFSERETWRVKKTRRGDLMPEIFVSTWNVGGICPPLRLNLDDWLLSSPFADIYVLGFQEIVPLNAGNVLGAENNAPAKKWVSLIRKTLNSPREQAATGAMTPVYLLVARKQMVGIFLTVWVRTEMKDDVRNLRVSCVGRGLMGRLGNKGSISISMSLHETSFCFVCCHLTSGQREGDELRRNSDVMEILRRSRFPPVDDLAGEGRLPETILDHSRIIWLGDLNYRVALSHNAARSLAQARDWSSLLENDQLHKEQRFRRVFEGWKEGKISFPPTYKYSANSDRFSGDDLKVREKRRTPAWCDRILWYGSGLSQLSYLRGDSKLSDHRPVFGVFSAEVELVCCGSPTKSMACSGSRIEVEELLP
ncbi:unnamed protein product [Spirodela intermedia]|uniref:Inositol polyphosphate-related phosphatase domain-containing protein n=1 Tax=Spirodela intermedia TaxID=51605 RepID=A0A7I8IXT1_SPIIN|nr:unnamed protein product [Spirodela intermedia]CAA6662774.1 unnamed protein product [Spirodela intermedia]